MLRRFVQFFYSYEVLAKKAGVKMGVDNFIASRFWSSEPYLITIGSHCQITEGVRFFTHGGGASVRHIDPKFDCFGKIRVGDYVYIGCNSLIMPGVILEDNVLVAAGSVVTKSVHKGLVVGGNPAKVLCTIEEYMLKNEQYNLRTKGLSVMEKMHMIDNICDEKFIVKKFM